jgi:hypothetical protein
MMIALTAFLAFGAIFNSSAIATTTTESAHAHSQVTSVAFKVVKQKGWIGAQEHIRIQKVPQSQCEHFKKFYNSNYIVGSTSKKPQMYVDHNGYLCRDKYSPTGWVKRGGGHTGSDCGNIAQPPYEKPKYKVVKPPILEVNSSSQIKVKVKIEVEAIASLSLSCGTATGSGFAYDLIEVKYSTYVKSEHSESLKLRLAAKVIAQAKDRAEATAEVQCNGSPPPPSCNNCQPPPCQVECQPPCTTCTPPPIVTNLETINDVEVNGYRTICAEFYAPAGESLNDLTIKFRAEYGSFAGNLQYKGGAKVCDKYTAPSEVPSGGHEIYSAFVRDNITGLTAEETKTFPIKQETPF